VTSKTPQLTGTIAFVPELMRERVKITKVSADVFDQPSKRPKLTPRQLARLELERSLERVRARSKR